MDFVTDQNPVGLYRADAVVGMPDYVQKQAAITSEQVQGLSDQAFADSKNRLFPVFDKVATWLSAAYFYGSRMQDPEIEERIKAASELHGIQDDIQDLESKLNDEEKQANTASDQHRYALIVDYDGEHGLGVQCYYPMDSEQDVVDSANQMAKDAADQKLPVEFFRTGALALVKEAKALGVEKHRIHDSVWAIGEERLPNPELAKKAADTRKWAGMPDEDIALLKEVADVAVQDPDRVDDCINLWLDLDSSHGVKYSRVVPDPYQAFYSGMEIEALDKLASESVIIEETLIPGEVVALVGEDSIRQHFRKEAADTIIKAQSLALNNSPEASVAFSELSQDERKDFLKLLLKL